LTSDRREIAGRESETIEITHEAILRHWPTLATWISEEQDALRVLDGTRSAARDWQAHGASDNWLTHAGERLEQAAAVVARRDFAGVIDQPVRDYLAACRRVGRRAAMRRFALQAIATAFALPLLVVGARSIYAAAVRPLFDQYIKYTPYARTNAALAGAGQGTLFQDCRGGSEDCPVMVVIPSGQFLMGAPDNDPTSDASEHPQHLVKIQRFAVSKFDITFAEWSACVDAGGCVHNTDPDDAGWGRGNRPVINVSWKDAQDYASWLSRMTGQRYRLLSEAEWEYVARAGTATAYFWGNAIGAGNANCTGCGTRWDGKQTAPVGSFKPNAFGLYDMVGNVWQWVADCANADYRGAPADGSAWTTGDCSYRVVRSGSWRSVPGSLRSSNRDKNSPTDRDDSNGFHLARSL
jgi:formylglycine-generating enzyme required for sulfatase activity